MKLNSNLAQKCKSFLAIMLSLCISLSLPISQGIFSSAAIPTTFEVFENPGFPVGDMAQYFDAYKSADAQANGMTKVDMTAAFDNEYGAATFLSNTDGAGTTAADKYVTTAIYKRATYKDVEIRTFAQSFDGNAIPGIVFGIKDTAKWVSAENNGYMVYGDSAGLHIKGYFGGEYKTLTKAIESCPITETQWYWFKVKVQNNTVRVEANVNGTIYTADFDIDASYTGGFVGFAAENGRCRFGPFNASLYITDLGGMTEVIESKDDSVSNILAATDKFDTYTSTTASTTGLTKANTFTDLWEDRDVNNPTGQTVNKTDMSGVSSDAVEAWNQQNEYVTSAIYNVNQFKNFELEIFASRWGSSGYGYAAPVVLFGVKDPTKWVTDADGGFAAMFTNEGTALKGVVNGEYTYDNDPIDHKADGKHGGVGEWTKIIVRVAGKTVTVTLHQHGDASLAFSYTYSLGDNYDGGYVGFAACASAARFWDFKITELADTAEEYPATPKPTNKNFVSDLSNAAAMADFDSYSSDNAAVNGFVKDASLTDSWSFENGNAMNAQDFEAIQAVPDDVTAAWVYKDMTVTNAIYNKHKYQDFEMTVTCSNVSAWNESEPASLYQYYSGNASVFFPATLLFGVEDPTKHVNTAGGGYAAKVYNDGNTGFDGVMSGEHKELGDNTIRTNDMPSGLKGWYILKIRVQGGKLTITVSHPYGWDPNPADIVYTYDLPEEYAGGYVGFSAPSAVCRFWNFSIVDLGGEAAEIVDVAAVEELASVSGNLGMSVDNITLPETVNVVAEDGNTYAMPVFWNTALYSPYIVGEQTVTGNLVGVVTEDGKKITSTNLKAAVSVTLADVPEGIIKVACVGDSITQGAGAATNESYPARLQNILGDGYLVGNFGHSGTTATEGYAASYSNSRFYGYSKAFQPDIVVIMLGTNDASDAYWKNLDDFINSYTALIDSYAELNPQKIYIATSPNIFTDNANVLNNLAMINEWQALLCEMSAEKHTGIAFESIDMYNYTVNHPEWFSDGVHPTAAGYNYCAYKFANAINTDIALGDTDGDGQCTATDLTYMAKLLLGVINAEDLPVNNLHLSFNSDDTVDLLDFVAMKKWVAAHAIA